MADVKREYLTQLDFADYMFNVGEIWGRNGEMGTYFAITSIERLRWKTGRDKVLKEMYNIVGHNLTVSDDVIYQPSDFRKYGFQKVHK